MDIEAKKNNFKFRGREGVKCPRVQVDVLSYEPLSKRIERFLSGDSSSLDGSNTSQLEYDEPEKVGLDDSVFEPGNVVDDPLNEPLDNLDIAELKCDSAKNMSRLSSGLKDLSKSGQNSDKSGQNSNKSGQDSDKSGQNSNKSGQDSNKSGQNLDESGQKEE